MSFADRFTNYQPTHKTMQRLKIYGLKRGMIRDDGFIFWHYSHGKEVWLPESEFVEKRATLLLRLKIKRQNNQPWRDLQNLKTSARNKIPDLAAYRLAKKRERYSEREDLRSRILEKNRQSRENLQPSEKRRRFLKHLEYCKNRYSKDPLFNLSVRVRRRIKVFLKGRGLDIRTSTRKMVGCDTVALKKHLESLFKTGMSWENKNKWHIDHIIPLASAKTESEILQLCHYTNLQPLWAKDNLTKGGKLEKAIN